MPLRTTWKLTQALRHSPILRCRINQGQVVCRTQQEAWSVVPPQGGSDLCLSAAAQRSMPLLSTACGTLRSPLCGWTSRGTKLCGVPSLQGPRCRWSHSSGTFGGATTPPKFTAGPTIWSIRWLRLCPSAWTLVAHTHCAQTRPCALSLRVGTRPQCRFTGWTSRVGGAPSAAWILAAGICSTLLPPMHGCLRTYRQRQSLVGSRWERRINSISSLVQVKAAWRQAPLMSLT
mmetsp:Transcript_10995/g.19662  ORF Transcript_10995/g.19662 Transcript_10995/m.19662 type:complete len:232 (-) Transcript_10995:435-1130(-)